MPLCLDSSVIVASILKTEPGSAACRALLDAIVAGAAKAANAVLVTLDGELIERLRGTIEVKRPSELIIL